MDEGGLWKWSVSLSLSLWELCEGNLEGGAPFLGTLKVMRGRLWRQASLSIGASLGNLEEGSFTRDFERLIRDGSRNGASLSLSLWELCEGLLYWGT
jgi:hypothetical protein